MTNQDTTLTAIPKSPEKKIGTLRIGPAAPVLLLLGLVIVDVIIQPALMDIVQIGYFIEVSLTIVLIGAAQTMAVLVRGLDLSVVGTFALGNTLAATWLGGLEGSSMWRIWIILAIGLLAGAINGYLIAYLDIQPVVATLATWAIYGGIALLILPTSGGEVPDALANTFSNTIAGLPVAYFWLAALLLLWACLKFSRLGLHIYAVGSDERRALLNGVRTRRTKAAAYAIGGLLATLAGVYLAATTRGGDPTAGGGYLLPSIVAVVVGGTLLRGGVGGVGLTVIGAITVAVLTDIITSQSLSTSVSVTASSILLLLAVGLRQVLARRKEQSS